MSLQNVNIIAVESGLDPVFIKKPDRITYQRDGDSPAYWEMVNGMDTVHILINKTDSQEILLAKQVRPPVLVRHPETGGICIECCAGMVDKYPYSPPEVRIPRIASDEVHEEMGYDVYLDDLVALPTYLSNVGMSGSTCHPFYCEVTDEDFIGQKLEPSEDIEVVAIPYTELPAWLSTCTNTDATTRQLVQWFLLNRCSK